MTKDQHQTYKTTTRDGRKVIITHGKTGDGKRTISQMNDGWGISTLYNK